MDRNKELITLDIKKVLEQLAINSTAILSTFEGTDESEQEPLLVILRADRNA